MKIDDAIYQFYFRLGISLQSSGGERQQPIETFRVVIHHHRLRTNTLPVLLGIWLPARMTAPIEVTSPPGTADPLVFTIKAATLRFDTRDEIEPYLIPLVENPDVEEVHLSGNTYGIEACKFLGEVLYAKKKLKVLTREIFHIGRLTCF